MSEWHQCLNFRLPKHSPISPVSPVQEEMRPYVHRLVTINWIEEKAEITARHWDDGSRWIASSDHVDIENHGDLGCHCKKAPKKLHSDAE